MTFHRTRRVLLLFAASLPLYAAALADAQSASDFTDWTSVAGSPATATGTLHGSTVSLSGSNVLPAGSTTDGTSAIFNRPEFTPPLTTSDTAGFSAVSGNSYTLTFTPAVTDPVLHLGSLGSTLHFPAGTPLTRVSGDAEFSVSTPDVIGTGEASGSDDANGTVRITGPISSITFTTTSAYVTDGVYLQVGAPGPPSPPPPPPPPPPTTGTTGTTPPPPAGDTCPVYGAAQPADLQESTLNWCLYQSMDNAYPSVVKQAVDKFAAFFQNVGANLYSAGRPVSRISAGLDLLRGEALDLLHLQAVANVYLKLGVARSHYKGWCFGTFVNYVSLVAGASDPWGEGIYAKCQVPGNDNQGV
jgi:hypothetical protein